MLQDTGSMIIFLIIIFVIIFHEKIWNIIGYKIWERKIKDTHNYDSNSIKDRLIELSHTSFLFAIDSIPYGRAKWFLLGNDTFNREKLDTIYFYAFSPVRSKEELDFHEYGILLTQNGLYAAWQSEQNDKKKSYRVNSEYCPFNELWKVTLKDNAIRFYYKSGKTKKINMNGNEEYSESLVKGINNLIKSGYTYDLDTGFIKSKIEEEISDTKNKFLRDDMVAAKIGAIGSIYANIPVHFKGELLNSIVNNPKGHGFAAEYANNLVDQVKNPFTTVKRVGQNNAKNGVDRIVGDVRIQSKYCATASSSVNAAFESKQNGGMYRYEGMQLEVPKDQYSKAVELMEKKIEQGKVPGFTDPADAECIVREGKITWNQAKLIAKGGNIVSIKYDVLDGITTSFPMAGVAFIIMFAQAKWSGETTKDAALLAAKTSITTLCVGTMIYTGSQQMAKIMTKEIAGRTGKKVMADNVAKNAGLLISFGIIVTPDIFNTLSGRISKQQLLKNTIVAGGGLATATLASMGAGAALGSIVPGAGNAVGAVVGAASGIVGGIIGSKATKHVMDHFIEDDRVEMFAQLKEEYIDVVMSISLTNDEFNKIQELIFDKNLEKKLRKMFSEINKYGSRLYARECIVESTITDVIQKRDMITDKDIEDALVYLQ